MNGKLLKIAAVACAAVFAVALAGCAGDKYVPEEKQAQLEPPAIGETDTLRVGVDTGKAPLAGIMESNRAIVGLDVDIAAAIADDLGLKLAIIDVGSDAASALADGTVDIVMGVNQSDADGSFWVSQTYLPTGIALFSTDPNAGVPAADSGATFAAQISSTSAWAVSNEFGAGSLEAASTLLDAFDSLKNGQVNYVAADAVIGLYTAHSQDMQVYLSAMLSRVGGYVIGASSSNAELQTAISQSVQNMVNGGVLNVIERKWLGTTLDLSSVPLTAAAQGSGSGTSNGDGSGADDSGSGDGNGDGTGSSDEQLDENAEGSGDVAEQDA